MTDNSTRAKALIKDMRVYFSAATEEEGLPIRGEQVEIIKPDSAKALQEAPSS